MSETYTIKRGQSIESSIRDKIAKLQQDKQNAGLMGDLDDFYDYEKKIEDLERKISVQNK